MSASEQPKGEAGGGQADDNVRQPVGNLSDGGQEVPLFLRDGSDGHKGNAQDEKDEIGE